MTLVRPSIASTPRTGCPDTRTGIHFASIRKHPHFWLPFTESTLTVRDLQVSEWVRFPLYLEQKKNLRVLSDTVFLTF